MEKLVPFRGTILFQEMVNGFPQVENFQARPDDVLMASYPKAGTTWMTEIVDRIYHRGDTEKRSGQPNYLRIPYLEMCTPGLPTDVEVLAARPSPRLIKTHLPAHLVPESFWKNKCKIIYMARNAKDVAVSSFFFFPAVKTFPPIGTWAEFLETFMAGEVFYGSWFDHVIGWWKKQENPDVLHVFYEDMKEDPMREIRKVAQFLEKDLGEEILAEVAHQTSFKAVKENLNSKLEFVPTSFIDESISQFLRKGVVGDWKNQFTVAQNERFDEQYERKMGNALLFRTEISVPSHHAVSLSSETNPLFSDQ